MIRNTHRVGDYLMVSDISGRTFYASEMKQRWDGVWVHNSEWEERNPQDFVRSPRWNHKLPVYRPRATVTAACETEFLIYVGQTSVRAPQGPAAHLFNDLGIGEMEVGCSFWVRPNP